MVMASPLIVPVVRVTGGRSALCAGLLDGFAKGLPLVEIARYAMAFRGAYVSNKDFYSGGPVDFQDLIHMVEIRAIPISQ